MPSRRYSSSRRSRSTKRSRYSRARSYKSRYKSARGNFNNRWPAAKSRSRAMPVVSRLANPETRYFIANNGYLPILAAVSSWTNTRIDPANGEGGIFAPSVGSGFDQRNGIHCLVRRIQIKADIRLEQVSDDIGATTPPGFNLLSVAALPVRVMLIAARTMYSSGFSPDDCRLIATTASGPTPGPVIYNSFWNPDSATEYRVLYDKTFQVTRDFQAWHNSTTAQNQYVLRQQHMAVNIDVKPHIMVSFLQNSTTGGMADKDTSFHLVAMRGSGGVATVTDYCDIAFQSRVFYDP